MVGCGLACLGGGGAGVSGCEFRGRGGGGTVGARIRGLRVSGRRAGGGGVLGDHTIWGGGGGVATRNTGPYIYTISRYVYIYELVSEPLDWFPFWFCNQPQKGVCQCKNYTQRANKIKQPFTS